MFEEKLGKREADEAGEGWSGPKERKTRKKIRVSLGKSLAREAGGDRKEEREVIIESRLTGR
jgi:hypothetical protein